MRKILWSVITVIITSLILIMFFYEKEVIAISQNIQTKDKEFTVNSTENELKPTIKYMNATMFKYDADKLFEIGGKVTDLEKQGIYFYTYSLPGTVKSVVLAGISFTLSDYNRWNENAPYKPYQGLVENRLDENNNIKFTKDAYGILDKRPSEGKEVYNNIKIPFIKSEDGYYEVDSSKNEYFFENGKPQSNTKLTMLQNKKITYVGDFGGNSRPVTGFFPFNTGVQSENENAKYHLGMRMEIPFYMTKNGKTDKNEDIVFEFTGDDDIWIFIDGNLVLDLGGRHDPISADINFSTGEIKIYANDKSTGQIQKLENLDDILGKNWKQDEMLEHNMSIFYLERGKGGSNLQVKFNLPQKSNVVVHHYIEGSTNKVPLQDGSLAEDDILKGFVNEDYFTTAKNGIDPGYELVKIPDNASGKFEEASKEVTYYYKKRSDLNYIVNYLEKGTNQKLADSKIVENQTYLEEITETAKNITGYNLVGEKEQKITIKVENNIINFYYEKRTDLNYKVNYLEKGTNNILKESKLVDNLSFGTIVESKNEVIAITGYIYDSVDKENITIGEKENIINIYYVKDEFSYTVQYFYDGIEDESKTENLVATYQDVIDTYTDKCITGYKLEKTENLPLTISEYPALNVIKIYYEKDKFEYTVNYYYDGVLDSSKIETLESNYGDVIETYKDKVKEGFKLEKVENLPLTITENSATNIINVYYVRKNSQVVVRYVDIITGKELLEEEIKIGKVFDKYDVSENKKEIDGYTLVKSPNPTTGAYTEETQIKTYYYAKNTKVIVKYLEKDETLENNEDNKVLEEEIIINGYVGKEYLTSKKEIQGYSYAESTLNTAGTMTENTITVIYYYIQNTKVVVNHIDKNSGIILETIEENGIVGDEYTSESKNFEGYVLVEKPVQETVIMTKDVITLNYYYAKVSAGVIEKHIDITTNEILDNKLYEGNEGDSYTTSSKEFEGYDFVEDKLPENASGIMTTELIEVNYYYIKKTSVVIQHIDKVTGELLEEETIVTGHVGDTYTSQEKNFESYDLVKEDYPVNSSGTMKDTVEYVKYYYIMKTKVLENHIDITTGTLLEKTTIHTGHEGDVYTTKAKEFEKYDLVENKLPDNMSGTMTKEIIEVNYYYIGKAKVVVEYIDKITGEKLLEIDKETGAEKDSTEIINGHEGDKYKTEEKVFDRYVIVKENYPTNTEGTMSINEDGIIYVRYYYVHESAGVVEKHIDIMTGKLLEEKTIYMGYEGDLYETTSKNFENYDLVEDKVPENATGTMKRELIEVRYYYIRKSKVIVKYLEKNTNKKLAEQVIIEGHEGDNYNTEEKSIYGFDLAEIPKNKSGKMIDRDIEVIYYYNYNEETENVSQIETPNTPEGTIGKVIENVTKSPNSIPKAGNILSVNIIRIMLALLVLHILQIKISELKINKHKK